MYGLSGEKFTRARNRAEALMSEESYSSSFEIQNELSQIDLSGSFTKTEKGASRNLAFGKTQKFI